MLDLYVIDTIVSVHDGDTFRANIEGWPAIIGEDMPVRLRDIDAPEVNGKCEAEKSLAMVARDRLTVLLHSGKPELHDIERGKYFRLVARVTQGPATP